MKTLINRFAQLPRLLAASAALLIPAATAWQAGAQVSLVSAQPANGATDVPVGASIVFTFSKPMDETTLIILPENPFFSGSLSFSGNVTATSFTPTWNEDFTTVTLDYTGDLPPGETVTWTINPANTTLPLSSEDADQVPTTSGSFTTAGNSCDPDGLPDEWGSISLFKGVTYLQTSTATPVLKSDEKPALFVGVESPANNDVNAATFTKPGSTTAIPLTPIPFSPPTFYFTEEFDSQALLDAAYPSGSYGFNLTRAQPPSPTVFSMVQSAGATYPPIPQVSNYTAAQAINPAQDFTLNFNALTGASGSDFIGLDISDSQGNPILSAPDLCIPLVLPNTATSFVIPANTLTAGQTYTVRLTFARTFHSSTTAPPDFASFGALQRQTVLTIATTGGGGVPQPQLTITGFPSGFFQFAVTGLQPGTNYRIQYSSTLQPNSWQLLQSLTSTTPMPITDLSSTSTTGRKYYRVITP